MKERGVETMSSPWSPFEMLLLKECALSLATAGNLEIRSLETTFNDAARLSHCLPSVADETLSLFRATAEKKKPLEIQNMFKRFLKEDDAFEFMFKNQICLNFTQ